MRKNILILAHSHEPQFVDIYNQYTCFFDKEKYCVTVLYMTTASRADLQEKTLAEQVVFANIAKKKLRNLKLSVILQLIKLCKMNQYEAVICHRYKPSYLMLIVARFCSIPKILFVMHGIGTMRSKRRQCFIRLMWQTNMLFAGVSNAVRDDLRKSLSFLPADKVVTLYNAIDVEKTEPQLLSRQDARQLLGIDENLFAFGHVARLEANKDQATLIRAFAEIQAQCANAHLYIVGEGVKEQELKTLVRELQLENKVIFTGKVPYAFRIMAAFDCFVLSSTQEAFGRVLLEAMIAKVPVIGTDAYGIPEVIADAGIVVPKRDCKALAMAMYQLYSSKPEQRKTKGEKAYQHAVGCFSLPGFYEVLMNYL